MSILNAAFAFQCDGKPVSYEEFGSGHINSTCIIKTNTGMRYVLQHINKYVFNGKHWCRHKLSAAAKRRYLHRAALYAD